MSSSGFFVSCVSKMSSNTKLNSLETSLQQSLRDFKELVKDFEDLCTEIEECKRKLITQTEMCESKNCSSAEALKKVIESKDLMIQQVASVLTNLYETRNLNIVNEALKIICGDTTTPVKLEPPHEPMEIKKEVYTPKKEPSDSFEDISFKEESSSEIEGTPGRTSPIIQSKKLRNGALDYRDKKKCPDDWPTSENKAVKLIYPTCTPSKSKGKGKLRQSRLNLVSLKKDNFVDLTCSPELMTRDSQNDSKPSVQMLVKKESMDNDETILPSPTSGPPKYPTLLKNTSKCSPFKKPQLSLKIKTEKPAFNCENSPLKKIEHCDGEDSINLLNPRNLKRSKENSLTKEQSIDYDETNCEIPSSLSILQRVNMLSPSKRPLAENKNASNLPPAAAASTSLLHPAADVIKPDPHTELTEHNAKRKTPDFEPVYKEPAPRKKAEKRALPGWSCEECKNFYDELYKDNPEMLEKKMNECSKHRGRNNPQRPKTPDGFWNPRWEVPDDTEEFNRRNNAI